MNWWFLSSAFLLSYQYGSTNCFNLSGTEVPILDIHDGENVYVLDHPDSSEAILSTDHNMIMMKGRSKMSGEEVALRFDFNDNNNDICMEKILNDKLNSSAILEHYFCGLYGNNTTVIVLEMPGKSIAQLRNNERFSLKTVLQFAIKLVNGLQSLHKHKYFISIVNPEFIHLAHNDSSIIKFINLSKAENVANHTPFDVLVKQRDFFTKTQSLDQLKYKSVFHLNNGFGLIRDDMEAAFYVILECLIGKLPWNDISSEIIYQKNNKMEIDYYKLVGRNATEIANIIHYLQRLEFQRDIDYNDINRRLRKSLEEIGGDENDVIDWTTFLVPNYNWADYIPPQKNKENFLQMENEDSEDSNE